jgi:hypothetical protein
VIVVKAGLVLIWIVCIAAFFVTPAGWAVRAQYLFFGILIAHAAECWLYLPRMVAAGGSLPHHLFQTMLFGFFHVRTLPTPQ